MKRKLSVLLLFLVITGIGYARYNRLLGNYRRIGSSHEEWVVVEKTGSSRQELIAGTSGKNIAMHALVGSVGTACTLYLGYGTSNALTKATPIYDLAAKDTISIILNDPITFPAGEGLDMWTSADPNEGWFGIAYNVYDYQDGEGTAY